MTLFAGLKVSTLGLSAQGTKMGAISDNIANVNTVGYKRTEVQFSTLVTERIRETRFTPGGVVAKPRQTVDQAGQLLGTGISTDFAVSGRGMFIVSEQPFVVQSTDGGANENGIFRDPRTSENGLAYTRAGSFRADQDGYLVNTGGFYLQGWAVNRNGDVTLDRLDPATINNSPGFADLQPVNVNRFSNIAEQTENLRTRANVPADFIVTEALSRPNLDPRRAFVLNGPATAGTGYEALQGTDRIIANGGTQGSPLGLKVTVGGNPVTFTSAELAAAGFDPTSNPPTDSVNDFITALDSLSATLSDGREVRLNGELTAGGGLAIRGTVDGAAATVSAAQLVEGSLAVLEPQAPPAIATDFGGTAGDTITLSDGTATYEFDISSSGADETSAAAIASLINSNATSTGGSVAAGAATVTATVNSAGNVTLQLFVGGVARDQDVAPVLSRANGVNPDFSAGAGDADIDATGLAASLAVSEDTNNNAITPIIQFSDPLAVANDDSLLTLTPAPAAGDPYAFTMVIDGEFVSFGPLTGRYDGTDPSGTLGALQRELSNVTATGADGATYDLEANIVNNGLQLIARRDGAQALIQMDNATFPGVSRIAFDGGAVQTGSNIPEGISQGVGTVVAGSTRVTGTYDDINARRTQFETIVGSAGNSGDFNTNSIVYDALGQPHQVQFSWTRYQSDVSGPNTWAVQLSDSSVTGVKIPLKGITDPDPTVDSDATVPRFITYNGDDGNDSVSANNITQSQTLFMKFNGDGSLEGVYTDPMLDPLSRVATRTNNPVDPLKMIQIAVGEVEIDPAGAAGGRTNQNLAVAKEINDGVDPEDPNFVPSPFGTDGAFALVFDWDVGRPTKVRTDADGSLNSAYAGTGLDGITQFDSGETQPALETFFTSQDGLRAGVLTGVGLDDDGFLTAFFDNGAQRKIYKVPLVSFVNFNGLINESGNVYRESRESGAAQINAAGQGFNGDLLGAALEQSNVELADEFTDMIITQQGFTANTRAITTTDEMLTDINNMVR